MKNFLVLVVLACLALDLGDAETTEKKDKEANKTTGGGGDSIVSDLLGSPEMIQSVMPKNMDEIFDMLEKFVPGMKQLQPLLEKTWKLMDPVIKVFLLQNKKKTPHNRLEFQGMACGVPENVANTDGNL